MHFNARINFIVHKFAKSYIDVYISCNKLHATSHFCGEFFRNFLGHVLDFKNSRLKYNDFEYTLVDNFLNWNYF